jgi:hypothetical protein
MKLSKNKNIYGLQIHTVLNSLAIIILAITLLIN